MRTHLLSAFFSIAIALLSASPSVAGQLLVGAVICTNQFELFTDYGIQMKARSKAVQTFVVQLAGAGTYLPTERAVRGGSYSAIVQSNRVGPEGGQVLVDKTVAAIDAVFAPRK